MSYVQQGDMTWCEDTPENWREFHAYKNALLNRWYPSKKYHVSSKKQGGLMISAMDFDRSSDPYRQQKLPDGSYGKGCLK